MDTRLARLMDDLQLQLPGVLPAAVQNELRNTLREFFIDTNLWTEDVTFKTKADVISYDITPEEPGLPIRLMQLQNADGLFVRYATMPEFGTLMLHTAPSQTETWTARVALTVRADPDKEGNPVFPKWVLERYYDTILSGVLARMMVQSAKPYANANMAAYYQRNYRNGLSRARHERNVENTYGGQRWRFPAFA